MNILLITNNNKDANYNLTKEVISYLKDKNNNIYSDSEELVNKFNLLQINSTDTIDFALIIGGDGTVLKYASIYGKCKFPYIGINMGRVGALTILEPNDYKRYIDRILNKDYYVCERMGLKCEIKYKNSTQVEFIGYNDIILHRSLCLKLLPIIIRVNESKEDLFYADGIVVATPSGSSAYNISAGGPLLSSSSNSYVITPICPQSKSFTSLVVGECDKVSLYIDNKFDITDKEITISADGCYKYFISPLDTISISKAESGLKMIQFNDSESIYKTVYKAVVSIEKKGEK